jgi:hypothetical protein
MSDTDVKLVSFERESLATFTPEQIVPSKPRLDSPQNPRKRRVGSPKHGFCWSRDEKLVTILTDIPRIKDGKL